MSKRRLVYKIFENILFVVLNLILIVSAVAVPFYYSIVGLTEPKNIATVVQNVDYVEVIEKSSAFKKEIKKLGIDNEKADKIMKSKETGELIEIYADEAKEILLDVPDSRVFDGALVKELVNQNMAKFINLAEINTNHNLSEHKIKKSVESFLEDNEEELEEIAPVLEKTRVTIKEIQSSTLIERTLSTEFLVILIILGVLFVSAICIIKRQNFNGILMIGIDFLISSLAIIGIITYGNSPVINKLAVKISNFGGEIIESAISVCIEKIVIAVWCTLPVAILFIAFYIILRCVKHKYENLSVKNSEETQSQEAIEN